MSLLLFLAEGCPTLFAPIHGWIQTEEGKLKLGCDNIKDIWHLKCSGNNWLGEMPNCTGPGEQTNTLASLLLIFENI